MTALIRYQPCPVTDETIEWEPPTTSGPINPETIPHRDQLIALWEYHQAAGHPDPFKAAFLEWGDAILTLSMYRENGWIENPETAERNHDIICAARAGIPIKRLAEEWGISELHVDRIIAGESSVGHRQYPVGLGRWCYELRMAGVKPREIRERVPVAWPGIEVGCKTWVNERIRDWLRQNPGLPAPRDCRDEVDPQHPEVVKKFRFALDCQEKGLSAWEAHQEGYRRALWAHASTDDASRKRYRKLLARAVKWQAAGCPTIEGV